MKNTGTFQPMKWSIYKSGVVADLTVHRWGARSKLRAQDLGFKESDIPEQFIHLGHKNLMKKEHLAKLSSISGKAEAFLRHKSFPFPIGDSRFIPFNTLKQVLDHEADCEDKYAEAKEDFLEDYDSRREEMLNEYRKIFHDMLLKKHLETGLVGYLDKNYGVVEYQVEDLIKKLEKKYPSKESLRERFNLDLVIFNVSSPEFLTKDEAENQAEKYMEISSLYKQKAGERIDSFLDDVVDRLKEMVLKTTKRMKSRLEGEELNQKTVKSFVRFADTFRDLDFIGTDLDSTLTALTEKLKGLEKSELSDDQVKEQLKADVEAIEEKAMAMDIDLVVGKFLRRIDLGSEEDHWHEGYEAGISDGLSH